MLKYCISVAAMVGGLWFATAPAGAVTKLTQSFDQWQVNCVTDAKNNKICALAFSLVNKKTKQVVFAFTVGSTSVQPKAKVVIRTITGVLLANGIEVTFPGTDPIKMTYKTCGPRACISEFDLSDNWLKTLSSKEKVTVGYSLANSEPIKHDIPLKSFQAAYDFMTSQLEKQD